MRSTPRTSIRRELALLTLPVFVALPLFTCTPTDIQQERFGSRAQSCYEFPPDGEAGAAQRSFNDGLVRPPDCPDPYAPASAGAGGSGAGGSGSAGAAGSGGGEPTSGSNGGSAAGSALNTGGSAAGGDAVTVGVAGAPAAGAGGAPPVGAGGQGGLPSGSAGTAGMMPSAGAGGMPPVVDPYPLPEGCTDQSVFDIFRADAIDSGGQGCQDTLGGCHDLANNGYRPNLISADVVSLLVGGSAPMSGDKPGCGEVWISRGATSPQQNFLWRRLNTEGTGPDEDCQRRMPHPDDSPDGLNADNLACVNAWIMRVANTN